jgi:predicted  nucleic acid-binding Zn-ribbon protein
MTGLPPDAFFAYCEAQMNGIDAEASGYFDQQQSSNVAKQTLNTIVGELQGYSKSGINDQTEVDKLTQELDTLESQYPQATEQIEQMKTQLNTDGANGTDGIVLTNEVQQIISQLNDLSTQMDSANQLSMIKLQSAMSAREQVLQLTSNILEAVDSGDSKVIGNIHS